MLRIRELFRRFVSDEQGVALILVAIMLPVIIGFAVLAIDMARVNNLHNDLQKGADAFALAGAAELDGHSDAIIRSNRAIANLIANQTDFSTLNHYTLKSTDLTVTFLRSLPASDSISLNKDGLDANGTPHVVNSDPLIGPTEARYVEITVNPTSFSTIFPASVIGGPDSFQLSAQAVAGYGSAVCDFTPMFICNPYSSPTKSEEDSLQDLANAVAGTQKPLVLLKENTGSGQYGPGNFGYLKAPVDSTGANPSNKTKDIADMFASINPKACYSQNGVQTRTGSIANMYHAINTRFDIFDNGGAYKTDPSVNPPAPNVRKGMSVKISGKNCSYSDTTNTSYMALPADKCFTSGSGCTTFSNNGRLGNGDWDFTGYWSVNHPSPGGDSAKSDLIAEYGSSPSRFDVYQYEASHPNIASGPEATTPACNSTTQGVNRRLLYVAVIDCDHYPVQGGGGTEYPVQAFASMFLTVPAGGPPDTDIYAELEDITTSYGQGTLKRFERNEAQLYR